MFGRAERAVRDDEPRQRLRGRPGAGAALRQPHASLQLVVVHAVVADNQEIVLLVTLRSLTLDVPIVFSSHLILVCISVHIQYALCNVPATFLYSFLSGQTVGHKLFSTFVHHTSNHSL